MYFKEANSLVHLLKEKKKKERILVKWLQTEKAKVTPICYLLPTMPNAKVILSESLKQQYFHRDIFSAANSKQSNGSKVARDLNAG